MSEPTFSELLKNESELQRIRETYFPLIEIGIISGYNIYPYLIDYPKGLFLNYLHSDLKDNDKHIIELSSKLRMKVNLEERIVINNKVVDRKEILERNADYLTDPNWDDPPNTRYFALDAIEISKENTNNDEIIAESLQYDLLLRVANQSELRTIIDIFKKYASKFRLNEKGSLIRVKNNEAITNSWEVPLLICTSNSNKKPSVLYDFLTVKQFEIVESIAGRPITLGILVRNKAVDLQAFLNDSGCGFRISKKYVLRVFAEELDL